MATPAERRKRHDERVKLGIKLSDQEVRELRRAGGVKGGKGRIADLKRRGRLASFQSKASKALWAGMTGAERTAMMKKAGSSRKVWLASMSPDELAAFHVKREAARLASIKKMPAAKKKRWMDAAKAGTKRWYASLTPEEKHVHRSKRLSAIASKRRG